MIENTSEFVVLTKGATNSKGLPKRGSKPFLVWKRGLKTLDEANAAARQLTMQGHYAAHGCDLRDIPENAEFAVWDAAA